MFKELKAKPAPCTDMVQLREQWDKNPAAWESSEKFLSGNLIGIPLGRHELKGGAYANVSEYISKDDNKYEYHENYIDIQYVAAGCEKIGICPRENLTDPVGEYNPEKDCAFFAGTAAADYVEMSPEGNFTILFPSEAHCPCLKCGENVPVKKIVVKVPFKK